jgi:hypothetical protein
MSVPTTSANAAFFRVEQDGWTRGIQLSITDQSGSGFRIAGPKFNGSSKALVTHQITERDANEIRQYLDQAFPQTQ